MGSVAQIEGYSKSQIRALIAAMQWQQESGVDEVFGESPTDRYKEVLAKKIAVKPPMSPATPAPVKSPNTDANLREVSTAPALPEKAVPEIAAMLAQKCQTLDDLRDALNIFDHCAPKKGARNFVFGQGSPNARIMVIADAPDREDDKTATCFSGEAGGLLDAMFAAIGFARDGLYLTQVSPWHPPQGRGLYDDEIAMMTPFLAAHVRLVAPELLVVMGQAAAQAVLGNKDAHRAVGVMHEGLGCAVIATQHPSRLLRDPIRKRQSWADLLRMKSYLDKGANKTADKGTNKGGKDGQ